MAIKAERDDVDLGHFSCPFTLEIAQKVAKGVIDFSNNDHQWLQNTRQALIDLASTSLRGPAGRRSNLFNFCEEDSVRGEGSPPARLGSFCAVFPPLSGVA